MRKTTLVAAIFAATVASANAAPVSERLARGASQSTKSADVRNSTSASMMTSKRSVKANVPAKAASAPVAAGAAAFTSARSAGSPSKGGGVPTRVATPAPAPSANARAATAPAAAETRKTAGKTARKASRKAVRQARARDVAKTRQVATARQASKSREARRAAALASKTDTVALERDIDLPDAPKPGAEAAAANLPTGSIPSMVTAMARAQGVSPALAHAVVKVESRYRPNATGPGGYIGLMQLSYQTAKGMGFRGSRKALYEPRNNLTYGMKYLAGAVAKSGGNTCAAVSKYQGGHGVRGVTRAGAVYCAKVKRFMAEGVPASGRRTADASATKPQS